MGAATNAGTPDADRPSAGRDGRKAILVGGGIASMAAAAFMIRDGDMLGRDVTIPEELRAIGGSLDGAGSAEGGYVLRGGRMLEGKYLCTFDLFASIPTLDDRMPLKLPDDLGAFLFAETGIEPGGTPLTVLSALARLGLDPWDEAGRLARQPGQAAASQLARSLAALPGTLPADADGAAAKLVALLPGRAAPSELPSSHVSGTGLRAVRRRAAVLAVAGVVTGLALWLAGHLAAAGGGAAASKPPGAIAGQP